MLELSTIQQIAIWILPVLFAVTLHEAAHGWVASRCGDKTALMLGRVSFNPIRHIDLVGTIIVPIAVLLLSQFHFVFGWAKPVPINWSLLKHPRRDIVLVTAAGPVSNLLMALFWTILLKLSTTLPSTNMAVLFLFLSAQAGILINLVLAFLNLLPIPPLDGGRIAMALLPYRLSNGLQRLEPYGFFILLALILTGVLGWIINPLINGTFSALRAPFQLMTIKILADASLNGLNHAFGPPFELSFYSNPLEVASNHHGFDVLLCRSTLAITPALLNKPTLKTIATASSGVDHIDQDFLQQEGIVLLDAKGCNAEAVADYVLACLAYLRVEGMQPKKAGIIGAGAVGTQVQHRLHHHGLQTIAYDPLRAMYDPLFQSAQLDELVTCDLLCVHANLHQSPPFPSFHLLNSAFLERLNPGTIIINAARGELIQEEAILKCKKLIYCTDVYAHEPNINPELIQEALLCTPHIAGHSIEAKNRAVTMLSEKLHAFYHLPIPVFPSEQVNPLVLSSENISWEQAILNLYNPFYETQQLKSNLSILNNQFITLRKQHTTRHHFNVVTPSYLSHF